MKLLRITLLLACSHVVTASAGLNVDNGTLKNTFVNQYSCINFGWDSKGNKVKESSARKYYYFTKDNIPAPLDSSREAYISCTGLDSPDSPELPRFDLISNYFKLWDKNDSRFQRLREYNDLEIHHTIRERLFYEYNIDATIDLFRVISLANSPAKEASYKDNNEYHLGYMMRPFSNQYSGRSYCPGINDYQSASPIFKILGDYIEGTEALYVANKEVETIQAGNGSIYVDATQMITETELLKVGFYTEAGKKIKADAKSFHTKKISYYYPINDSMDPLEKGDRKLFSIGNLDGTWGWGPTTDLRIGCIPKSAN